MQPPGPTTHRLNRRKKGRGQANAAAPVYVTLQASGSTATINFSAAVVVTAAINFHVAGANALSQAVLSAADVSIHFDQVLTGRAYNLPTPPAGVKAATGGEIVGTIGTF